MKSVLLGFSDFFDEMGVAKKPTTAVPAPKKPTPPPPPPAGMTNKNVKLRPISKAKQSSVVKQHAQVLQKAKATLLKAARGLGHAQISLAKRPPAAHAVAANAARQVAAAKVTTAKTAALQAQQSPSVSSVQRSVVARGAAAKAILGAVAATVTAKQPVNPAVVAKLSAKAKAAVAKHNKAVLSAKKAAQALAQHTLQTKKSVHELAKAAINQKNVSKRLRTKGGTHVGTRMQVGVLVHDPVIGEEVREALGDYYTHVGADPDPNNPGFLTDGTPDPAYATTLTDPTAVAPTDTTDTSLLSPDDSAALSTDDDNPLDSINAAQGLPAMPPDQPTEADYKAVGGVLYNEAKGRPNGFVGSYGLMTRATSSDAPGAAVSGSDPGVNDYGVVWGSFDQDGVPNGTPWGGRLSENTWNEIFGRYVRGGSGTFNQTIDASTAFSSPNKIAPNNVAYGPLIGNPGMPDFKGMRVDSGGNLFWYPQEAPDWLTAPLKQAAALTAAKQAKAQADADKQAQLQQAKAAQDAAAAQAAQDAANALAESQAASEARQADSASQAQQSQEAATQAQQETQSEAQAQQQILQQSQADQEQQASDAAQEKQAQDILIQRAQRQEALMAQNPDIELALMAQQQLDQGGDEDQGDQGDQGGDEDQGDQGGDEDQGPTNEDAADYSEGNDDNSIDYSSDDSDYSEG